MPLFEMPKKSTKSNKSSSVNQPNIKLKKGQTIDDLVLTAKQLVEEKLKDYKDVSKCITNKEDLINFFNNSEDIIGIDTETTGLNFLTDQLVGISLCNGKEAVYIPINHKSSLYNIRLLNQIAINDIKEIFGNIFKTKNYKWIYHNAKFDLAVLRTFFGYPIPDPYWDTMLAANLFDQDEEHNLKYLYNKSDYQT